MPPVSSYARPSGSMVYRLSEHDTYFDRKLNPYDAQHSFRPKPNHMFEIADQHRCIRARAKVWAFFVRELGFLRVSVDGGHEGDGEVIEGDAT